METDLVAFEYTWQRENDSSCILDHHQSDVFSHGTCGKCYEDILGHVFVVVLIFKDNIMAGTRS